MDVELAVKEVIDEFVRDEIDPDTGDYYRLRSYQTEFLTTKATEYDHVATFDEMGTGKTLQLIALDAVRRKQAGKPHGKTLVVAPLTGVIDQWVVAFQEWCPNLTIHRVNTKNAKARKESIRNGMKADVFIIHPDGLRLEKELLKEGDWLHFIFDEIHTIKNRKAKTSKAAVEVGKAAQFRSGGSGTPIENRTDEAWHILKWLYPTVKHRRAAGMPDDHRAAKLFSSYWRFYSQFVDYIVDPDYGYHIIQGVKNQETFRKLFGPFYIRRLKKEVLKDLPPKLPVQYIDVELHPQQRRAYNQMKKDLIAWVGAQEDQALVSTVVIAQLTRLQQFTLGYGEIKDVTVNKRDGSKEVKRTLKLTAPSSKLDALIGLAEQLGDSQLLVYSTSKQAINMAESMLEKAGYGVSKITGDVTDAERTSTVKKFQDGTNQIMVATIRAGGVGMNLQNCHHVAFLDRDWSPAKNDQAEDRSHRSGQTMPVNIYEFRAKDTIDYKKHDTIVRKKSWIMSTIG